MEPPHCIMDKMWQMMQSKDQDRDFEDIMDKVKQVGWNESTKTKRFWIEEEDEEQ